MNRLSDILVSKALANNPQLPVTLLPSEKSKGYEILVDKIKTGEIELSDIPLFMLYFIEILVIAAGIIAFIMILYGGYQYVIGGVYSEMKEKGKTTLTHAIVGFVIALLSYVIVSIIQLAATSPF